MSTNRHGTINQRKPVYAGFVASFKCDGRLKRESLRFVGAPWEHAASVCADEVDAALTVVGQTQRSMRLEGTGVVVVVRKLWTDANERVVATTDERRATMSDPVPTRAMVERALVVLVETIHGEVWAADAVRLYLAAERARLEKPILRSMDKMMRALGHEPPKANQ